MGRGVSPLEASLAESAMTLAESAIADASAELAAAQQECVGGVSPRACTATHTRTSPENSVLPAQKALLAEISAMTLAESAMIDALGEFLQASTVSAAETELPHDIHTHTHTHTLLHTHTGPRASRAGGSHRRIGDETR